MFKTRSPKFPAAAMLIVSLSAVEAMAGSPSCSTGNALRQRHAPALTAGLLPIRDTQSGGRGGGSNSCWGTCFTNYNECVDMRPKPHCVATMKLCMETCDRLSNRPGT